MKKRIVVSGVLILSIVSVCILKCCTFQRTKAKPHIDIRSSQEEQEKAISHEINLQETTTEQYRISEKDIIQRDAGIIVTKEELKVIDTDLLFYETEIPDIVFERMQGKSYKEDCTISRENLRYIRILYYGFDDETHVGEVVSHKDISKDLVEIFKGLWEKRYPIEKVVLVDEYDADDMKSMRDNNTSCFNFRTVPGSSNLSNHAKGLAIDINPLYNPYLKRVNGEWICQPEEACKYADRSESFPHKIDEEDFCYRLFHEHGFFWGGHWNNTKDYQHFQKVE